MTERTRTERVREWLALEIAPWLYFHNRDAAEEAFRDLAEVAYGSRDAIWTSHRTLVETALEHHRMLSRTRRD